MTHVHLTTREDIESLCDDAAATGNSELLRKVATVFARTYGFGNARTTIDALQSRAKGIENRLAGRIHTAQAYEDQSEARIELLPERLTQPLTTEV